MHFNYSESKNRFITNSSQVHYKVNHQGENSLKFTKFKALYFGESTYWAFN